MFDDTVYFNENLDYKFNESKGLFALQLTVVNCLFVQAD